MRSDNSNPNPLNSSFHAIQTFNSGTSSVTYCLAGGNRLPIGRGKEGGIFEGEFSANPASGALGSGSNDYASLGCTKLLAIKTPVSQRELTLHKRLCEGARSRFDYHIVTNLGATAIEDSQCMVMTKINGRTLKDYFPKFKQILRRKPNLQRPLIHLLFRLFLQGLIALQRCAECHIIHGDISCSNLLLDENFDLFVCDFGLARDISSPTANFYPENSRYCNLIYANSVELTTIDLHVFGLIFDDLLGIDARLREVHPNESRNAFQELVNIRSLRLARPDEKTVLEKLVMTTLSETGRPSAQQLFILARAFYRESDIMRAQMQSLIHELTTQPLECSRSDLRRAKDEDDDSDDPLSLASSDNDSF